MKTGEYNRKPFVQVRGHEEAAWRGWSEVADMIARAARGREIQNPVVVIDCYTGVFEQEIVDALAPVLQPARTVRVGDALLSAPEIEALVEPDLTDDPVFGRLTSLTLDSFFDPEKLERLAGTIRDEAARAEGPVLVIGIGARLVTRGDLLVYADMPRWEHQLRYRRGEVSNLGVENRTASWQEQYKRGYFVDWRVCDGHKWEQIPEWDFVLDTTRPGDPRLVTAGAWRDALGQAARQPFSLVPFFDPAPWGGQWMREVCGLDGDEDEQGPTADVPSNYGWCFNCVPEENSLLLRFGSVLFETPGINLVAREPDALLGQAVKQRFGVEFPIRFDFLDTMGGGTLSLQVHPLASYIREHFGLGYTQDESYYLMDAREGAVVYLGLKEGCDPDGFARDLHAAQEGHGAFPADTYVNRWPARKHDHFSIPAGTVHCSGRDCMVLEISATPYIFTFKLWDWDRLGLDGRPRPIHIDRGLANIQWDRTTGWVRDHLVDNIEPLREGPGWREERTGLDALQFIEVRRCWFTDAVPHDTQGTVDVVCLVEGDAILIESAVGAFPPFRVNYAEVFVVPAAVGAYTVRPAAPAGHPLATVRATVPSGA